MKQNYLENTSKKIDFNKTTSEVKFEVKCDDESNIETQENTSLLKQSMKQYLQNQAKESLI